jgi:hypothetical protein
MIKAVLRFGLVLVSLMALLVAGCGGSGASLRPSRSFSTSTVRTLPQVPKAMPAPKPTHQPASAQAVAVIRGWSDALRSGHVQAAARYFQLPSVLINGVGASGSMALIHIHTLVQAEVANESLPCGAKFISADQRGRYINARFELTARTGPGGSSCGSGAGSTARTNFVIAGGHIVEWIRAPNDPGDPTAPAGGAGGPTV